MNLMFNSGSLSLALLRSRVNRDASAHDVKSSRIRPGFLTDLFRESTQPAKLLITPLQQLFRGNVAEVTQITEQVVFQGISHFAMVTVCAAQRFRNDVIDDAELDQLPSREPKRVGGQGLGLLRSDSPQDARATLGANDGVVGVFEHADAVANADA